MTGIEMMLKASGFDKEKIQQQIQLMLESLVNSVLQEFRPFLDDIESMKESMLRIEMKLETLPDTELEKIIRNYASNDLRMIGKDVAVYDGRNLD